ncbi:MAG: hypothetical protein ACREXS_04560, partial [Gammaproteobacteria bacterium]
GFSRFVTSATAPIATGWSESCRAGFAPAERPCLGTAHEKVGLDHEPPAVTEFRDHIERIETNFTKAEWTQARRAAAAMREKVDSPNQRTPAPEGVARDGTYVLNWWSFSSEAWATVVETLPEHETSPDEIRDAIEENVNRYRRYTAQAEPTRAEIKAGLQRAYDRLRKDKPPPMARKSKRLTPAAAGPAAEGDLLAAVPLTLCGHTFGTGETAPPRRLGRSSPEEPRRTARYEARADPRRVHPDPRGSPCPRRRAR